MSVVESRRVQGPASPLDPATQLDLFTMHRTDDIDTAQGAAVIAIRSVTTNRQRALEALYKVGEYGATDFELAALTGIQPTSIGVRRKELRDLGLVRRASGPDGSSLSRPSPTNTPAAVWTLTAAGVITAESRPS